MNKKHTLAGIVVLTLGALALPPQRTAAQAVPTAGVAGAAEPLDIASLAGKWKGTISSGHTADIEMVFQPGGSSRMTIHFPNGVDTSFQGSVSPVGALPLQSAVEGLGIIQLTMRRQGDTLTGNGVFQQKGVTQPPRVLVTLARVLPAAPPPATAAAPPPAPGPPSAAPVDAGVSEARKTEAKRTARLAILDAVKQNQVDVGAIEDLQNQIEEKKNQLSDQMQERDSARGSAQYLNEQGNKMQAMDKQGNDNGLGGVFGGMAHLFQSNDQSEADRCQGRIDSLQAEIKQLQQQIAAQKKMPKPLVVAHRFIAAGQWPEAEFALREMLGRDPANPDYHSQIGDMLARQQEWDEAASEYREAVRANTNEPGCHNKLGLMLRKQKKYPDAEAEYREASRLAPDNGDYKNDIGITLYEEGRYKEAEGAFRDAAKNLKDDPRIHGNIGNALVKQSRYKDAEGDYKDAIKLDPKNGLYHAQLAECLLKRKKVDDAKQEARLALQLGCKAHPVFEELGIAR